MEQANSPDARQENKQKKKPVSIIKMIFIFMMISILCSFILNIFLYRRINSLKKQIDQLSVGAIITAYIL